MRLRTKVLATTLATRAQDLAATGGCFTCEEAVTAGTYEIAGLKSPLHIVLEFKNLLPVPSTNKKGRLIGATGNMARC